MAVISVLIYKFSEYLLSVELYIIFIFFFLIYNGYYFNWEILL